MYNIKGREVLWDMFLADKNENVKLEMHKPVRKNISLECDAPWEGEHCGYGSLIYDGEKYRLYYRGLGSDGGPWKNETEVGVGTHCVWCVAYSDDGKNFYKPNLGKYEFQGSKDNNIFHMEDRFIDNFAVMYDTNPDCPEDEKYKAFSQVEDLSVEPINGIRYFSLLAYYKSKNGIDFEYVRNIDVKGSFDSLNFAFWDADAGLYRIYFRGFHTLDENNKISYEHETHVRDIRTATSPDFVNWTELGLLDYGEDKLELQLYTNNVQKYYRANRFFGMPTRYIDRSPDKNNYKYLPDVGGFRPMLIEKHGRGGTAITEGALMVSRDGLHFDRFNEAYLTPGIENGDNWVYGDGYFARGLIETASEFKGEPNELSFFVGTGYRARPVSIERYTLRIDGFLSWSADFKGGEVLTKPFTFEGAKMSVNFATSALGYLHIVFCDGNGKELSGYDSGRLFGNTIERPVDFEKELSELNGKTVRMRISMKDAEFYSFNIE